MNITIDKLLKIKNPHIIDIRNRSKYLNSHIPGSICIDEYELLFNTANYLDKDEVYYIYCDSGSRSLRVVSNLIHLGYKAVNIDGGYNNYLLRN